MVYFGWTPEYSVKIAELDDQHKKLLEMMNKAYEQARNDPSPAEVSRLLHELNEYAIAHFSKEEKYMLQTEYKDYEDHKGQHEYFYDQIARFKTKLGEGDREIYAEIADFLKSWFLKHILTNDQKYSGHFIDAGIG